MNDENEVPSVGPRIKSDLRLEITKVKNGFVVREIDYNFPDNPTEVCLTIEDVKAKVDTFFA